VIDAIWAELPLFCVSFPCEVSAAAPPLGKSDGRLNATIAYAEQRTHHSLFFKGVFALLSLASALYPRSTGLLNGHLRLQHLLFQPPTDTARGGLVVRLILPKKNKRTIDLRHDSHPVPMGPVVTAVLAFLHARGLVVPGAPPDAVIFPDIHPTSDVEIAPALTVHRSTYILRRYVFIPSGVQGGHLLTLRSTSIRYGASTDAAIAGVREEDRLATGGWRSTAGARPYLDRTVATLLSPPGTVGAKTAPATNAMVGTTGTPTVGT
jgi:predicted RecA/RadA family phage recombinase